MSDGNIVDFFSYRGVPWSATVAITPSTSGAVARLEAFSGSDGYEVAARCLAFAAALRSLSNSLERTGYICGAQSPRPAANGNESAGPVEWRYLHHGKGGWKHVYNADSAGKLYEENLGLSPAKRHVIQPLYLGPPPPPIPWEKSK